MAKTSDRHPGGRQTKLPRTQLGETIERLARRRGLLLDQLAANSGVRLPTIYRIMTGRIRDPRGSTRKALADALGVSVAKLY